MPRALLFLYAESPVHAGADTSLGAVDLPIQREASTRLPVIWGQSLKGALRAHARDAWSERPGLVEDVFGSPPPGAESLGVEDTASGRDARAANGAPRRPGALRPGTLSVGDAQLVAFPVPTIREIFAWVSSPLLLGRLARRAALAGFTGMPPLPVGDPPDGPSGGESDGRLDGRSVGTQEGRVDGGRVDVFAAGAGWHDADTLVGPYVTRPGENRATRRWADWLADSALPTGETAGYFAEKMRTDLLTVPDGALVEITRECIELTPRVQLSAEKTVQNGPFYSEFLPAETVLAALLEGSADHLAGLRTLLDGQVLRLGGNETIGKGLLWCRWLAATDARPTPAPAAVATSASAGRGEPQRGGGQPLATPPVDARPIGPRAG
ncbi:type III-B CRISPR module RAMP protein Cmr4, partial [Frankia sp. AiPs1]|uniref:type III-B CRISPR module RAMP protein Cmr4 n=1 Tax=Frankia sp. AiPs1 TaxID=573493 RepID=UPI002044AAD4